MFQPFFLSATTRSHSHSHSNPQIAPPAWLRCVPSAHTVVMLPQEGYVALCRVALRGASHVPPLARVFCAAQLVVSVPHGPPGCLLGVLDCLAGMLALSLSPVATFARHAPIWSPSNSNRPTFVASASSHSRPSLVGSGFRLVSSPGEASPYQGIHCKTRSSAISGLCQQHSLLAAVESQVIIITHAETRNDTTLHDTIRSALDSHAVSLEFDTACAPGCVHLSRSGQHNMTQQSWEPLSNPS